MTNTNEEWAAEIKAGRAGYGELWQQVQAFVRQQAARYFHQNAGLCVGAGVVFDDLFQAGFLALCDAVNGYDPAAGLSFVGYLALHLKRHFREACGIRTTKHDPILQAARLDKPVSNEDGAATLGELTPDKRAEAEGEAVEDRIFREQLHEAMEKALGTLEPTQREAIRQRYYGGLTLGQTGAALGRSRERVRQTEQKALRSLRKPQTSKLLRPFIDELRSGYAWHGTGWAAFLNNGASSVERAAEKTGDLIQRLNAEREQSKARYCAMLHITPEEFDRRYSEPPANPQEAGLSAMRQ